MHSFPLLTRLPTRCLVHLRCKRWLHLGRAVHQDPVRVRFAPSPTGQLHLGGLRTALYNYLFAKSQNGTFILRVEDTDRTRLVPGAMEKLLEMLGWAGIQVDEGPTQGGDYGPYVQSERTPKYWEMIQPLLQNGTAYHCFCSERRLNLMRKDSVRRGEVPKYDNKCRHMSTEEVDVKLKLNTPYVIRFKLETYLEPWEDLVYGPITYDVASIEGDPVLLKTDRFPTYHFANVVDDHLMKVSHVLRGVEWQVSTTKHILMYQAFGWQPPKFAHLPLLLNKDGTKLSKRQNDIHVEHFKNTGCSAEALLNLITHSGGMGFKVRDTRGMTLDNLIKEFDLCSLKTNSTRIDLAQIQDLNRMHLQRQLAGPERSQVISELGSKVKDKYGDSTGDTELQADTFSDENISRLLDWAKNRIQTADDLLGPDFEFLWHTPGETSLGTLSQCDENIAEILTWVLEDVRQMPDTSYNTEYLPRHWRQFTKLKKLKFGMFMKVLRSAISGLQEGPPVAEIMIVLGKEPTVKRLQHVIKYLEEKR